MNVLKVNGKGLLELSEKNGWKGDGTDSNPFIIKEIQDKSATLILKNIEMYIIVFNCKVKSIKLVNCFNISLNQCQSHDLYLLRCFQNEIKNSVFKRIKIKVSGGNSFENNKLSSKSLKYLNSNYGKREILPRLKVFSLIAILIILPLSIHSIIFSPSTNLGLLLTLVIIILGVIFLLDHFFMVKWQSERIPRDDIRKNRVSS